MGFFQYGALVEQVSVIATAAGTTTLTNTSKQNEVFTGSANQTIVLPNATTMSVGQNFNIFNQSTGTLTLEFNGGGAFTDASGKNYNLISAATSLEVTLQTNGTAAGTWAVVASSSAGTGAPGPTVQKFLSGSGTYTTPANVSFISVKMVGGGGGGGGSGTGSPGNGVTGTASTFGTSLLTANGGVGGSASSAGGAGGTASLGSGPIGTAFTGGAGSGGGAAALGAANVYSSGGMGGANPFGGAGAAAINGAGLAGSPNTGAGGGGGGEDNTHVYAASGGGGAGGFVDAIIVSPAATYAYAVGTGGTGGTAGTSGFAGGAGGLGYIQVTEYYFNGLGASAGNGGAYTPTVSAVGASSHSGGFSANSSGTYTTPANVSFITIEVVGGGGGGSGSGTGVSAGNGGNGTNTTFGPLTAGLGYGGQFRNGPTGGEVNVINSPAIQVLSLFNYGNSGGFNGTGAAIFSGGAGGTSPFGGAGTQVYEGQASALANTGSGGSGGSSNAASVFSGTGGDAGGYIKAIIVSPASSYSYTVGGGGTAGTLGTSGSAGGAGGSGYIVVTEYYNNGAVGTATTITGSITSAQVTGTTTGGNATAGNIGEFISANSAGVAVGSSGAFVQVASISLTAGDWDVEGTASLVTGGTTAGTILSGGISLNPTSEDSQTNGGVFDAFGTLVASSTYLNPTGKRRINVSTTTTVYLVGAVTYSVAGGATWGTNSFIGARRVR